MKKATVIILTLLAAAFFWVPGALADEGTLQAANALYENGSYSEAIQAYQQLVDQGSEDARLYYNLGNAYIQSGEPGQAILNYRRAETLAPRDADIQHNLELARSQVTDQFSHTSDDLADIYLAETAAWLSLDEIALMTLALWTLLCLSIFAIRRRRDGRFRTTLKYSLVPLLLVFVLAAFTFSSRLQQANDIPDAVIVAEVADVFAGPGNQYGSDYQLHGGAEVELYQTRGDWSQIGINGLAARGWVPATVVKAVSADS